MSGHHRQSDATPDDDSDPASDNASGVSAIMRRLDRLWVDRPHGQPIYDLNGREVAGYTLRDVIGQGTFGVVYLADDAEQQRQVALKLPRPEVILQADRMRRFRKEASIAASLDHPCIVPVYATDFDGPSPYIVSAYVDGPDLGEWLGEWLGRAARPVDFLPAARFVAKLADAVHHAHERGVTHRDLKPGNVLLQSEVSRPHSLDDYSPRLTDFGLAGTLVNDAHSTRASMVIGTPLYMAPEQAAAAGGADSPRADVYSLGVLLYELVTKQTPLEGLNYHQVLAHLASDEPTDVTSARADVPVGLQAILKKCLQHDAADRYASAAALAEDLARFVDGQKPLAPPPRATDGWVRWMRRPRRLQLAGTYSLFFHTGVILWLVLVMLIAWAYGVEPTGGFSQNLWDIVAVVTLCHFPKAMLGWLLIKGRNWTYLPSLFCSVVLFVVFVQSAVGESVAFEQNYPTRFSKLSNFSILITASLGEIVFYLVAWPAWRRATR